MQAKGGRPFSTATNSPSIAQPKTTFGFGGRRSVDETITTQRGKELAQTQNGEVPILVPSPPDANSDATIPPDLASVGAAWGDLPEAIKAGILAIIVSSAKALGCFVFG